MTELKSADIAACAAIISDDLVVSIYPTALYYIFTGRNAWHSTWIQRYSPGCMHSDFKSAKNYAELRRIQGTVFNIKELPALAIRTTSGKLFLITEINTTAPLANYSQTALREAPPSGTQLIENASNEYLMHGHSAQGALLSFASLSRFWRVPPPKENGVIIVHSNEIDFSLPPLPRRKLKAWQSYSHGPRYLLGWKNVENLVDCSSIRRLSTTDLHF